MEIPDDFYAEEVFFKDPDELPKIFEGLEEKNLKSIAACQETEASIDHFYKKMKHIEEKKGNELMVQEQNYKQTQKSIIAANESHLELLNRNKVTVPDE